MPSGERRGRGGTQTAIHMVNRMLHDTAPIQEQASRARAAAQGERSEVTAAAEAAAGAAAAYTAYNPLVQAPPYRGEVPGLSESEEGV